PPPPTLLPYTTLFRSDASATSDGPPIDPASIKVPRPIAPLSTARTTSQRPTLKWSLPTGVDGAHVEVCADRACSTVQATFDAIRSEEHTSELQSRENL